VAEARRSVVVEEVFLKTILMGKVYATFYKGREHPEKELGGNLASLHVIAALQPGIWKRDSYHYRERRAVGLVVVMNERMLAHPRLLGQSPLRYHLSTLSTG